MSETPEHDEREPETGSPPEPAQQDGDEESLVRRVARAGLGSAHGFYFYGVARTRGRRGREPDEVLRVRYRDLEALVRPGPYKVPALDATHVQAHHRIVEGAMRRGTVLPAPFGVVFRGRRALVRFLED